MKVSESRYQTRMVSASSLRRGMVLYYGGQIVNIERGSVNTRVLTKSGRVIKYPHSQRVRVYPYL